MTHQNKCQDHEKLLVDIAEIKTDVKHLCSLLNSKVTLIDNHILESNNRCIEIRKNSDFRCGATRALWILYTAVSGIITSLLLLPKK